MIQKSTETAGHSASDILIAEDEPAIARLMALHLQKAGYSVSICADGIQTIQQLKEQSFKLLLLDRMLPGKRGLDILRWLRKQPGIATMPVLMVTALGSTEERIHGLKEGADDYLPKPFEPEELVARIQALLRRSSVVSGDILVHEDDIQLNEESMEARIHDIPLDLRPLEFKLLQVLMKKPDKVRSREYLLDHVWGINSFVELRTVDVTIKRLRKTLGEHGYAKAIKTIRGSGYRYSKVKKET